MRDDVNPGADDWSAPPDNPIAPGRILIVDDEVDAGDYCAFALARVGKHEVRVTQSPRQARQLARDWRPDVILLDIEMREMDGLTLARLLQEDECDAHLMFVTRRNQTSHRIQGMNFADQYLAKPFHPEILLANVNAMLRRRRMTRGPSSADETDGRLILDQKTHNVTIPPRPPVHLAPRQWELLTILVEAKGKVVTKERLLREMWQDTDADPGLVQVNISRLRKCIEVTPSQPELVIAAKGGYYFNM